MQPPYRDDASVLRDRLTSINERLADVHHQTERLCELGREKARFEAERDEMVGRIEAGSCGPDARTLQSALPAGPQATAGGEAHVCANCQKPLYAPEGARKSRHGLMWLGVGCATMTALASIVALTFHIYVPVDLPPPPMPVVDEPPVLPPRIRLGPPPTPPIQPSPLTPLPIFTVPSPPPGNTSAPPALPNEGPAAPNVKPPPIIRIPGFHSPPKAQPAP